MRLVSFLTTGAINMAKAAKNADHPAVKAMQAQREDRAKANEEAMKRMDSSQPTPTQEENDLAKLGVVVEEKEDDKSGETVITKTIVANQPLGPHGYETRATKAKE
jgi:transcription elongation GreA/GreB family factor